MRNTVTTITETFRKDGTLKSRVTETAEVEGEGCILPRYSANEPSGIGTPVFYDRGATCDTGAKE